MGEKSYAIGRLLRAGISGFVAGTKVLVQDAPRFGAMVRAPIGARKQIYGLIHDIHIDDDGLVRQLVTSDSVDESVIADNRENRNVPLEMSVLAIGYQDGERIFHLLPPRPPLSLDILAQCTDAEIVEFTAGGFGYLRHLLRNPDIPIGELIAAHVQQSSAAHAEAGNADWAKDAAKEIIMLLRDDYPTMMQALGALKDAMPNEGAAQ
jgi:hypothetical protein